MKVLAISTWFVLVAGCATQGPVPTDERPNHGRSIDHPLSFVLNSCDGFLAEFPWAGDLGPGEAPPGWEEYLLRDPLGRYYAGSVVTLRLVQCERVSWGDFERPATFLFETHSRFNEPEACRSDSIGSLDVLNSLWVNDKEIAEFLSAEYRVPAVYGEFTNSFDEDAVPSTARWSWNVPDGEASYLTATWPGNAEFRLMVSSRVFWVNGVGVSWMDLEGEVTSLQVSEYLKTRSTVFTGTMEAPMLFASTGMENWASDGEVEIDGDMHGTIQEFQDYLCERPK